MHSKVATREMLINHCQTYPMLQIQDIFKFLYQSSFGCEHLLSNHMKAIEYLRKEAVSFQYHEGAVVEPLDGAYCRVHLDCLKDGLSVETLGRLFILSAEHMSDGKNRLEEKLAVMLDLAKEGFFGFSEKEALVAVEKWKAEGYPAYHHSDEFRSTYFPAYRVIKKEYAMFLPLFSQIDRMLQKGKVTLAIEGGSASGKSTLARLLEQVYDCMVFHMDDFFLQPHQRSAERLAEPGGNVDRERFFEEVLIPISQNKPVNYRRFDCSTCTLLPPVALMPAKLNVIEGAYSMHPLLADYYDFSVFLDITSALQRERILKRNSPEMAGRFFEEWIPMEQHYFDKMNVKKRCNMVIDVQE